MKVTYVTASGRETTVEAVDGDSLMWTGVRNDIREIVGECGGVMSCASCHVYVQEPFLSRLPPPSEMEDAMLDCTASERRENSRLSCQITACPALDGIVVLLPERQQ